jgi:hypothetical protein
LQEVGKRTRAVLEGLGQVPAHWHDISNVVERLGTPEAHGFPKPLVELLRQQLRKEFNVSDNGDTTFDYQLVRAMLEEAGDPETEVPTWLEQGCPTGIGDSVIRGCGVFPAMDATSAAIEGARVYARMQEARGWRQDLHKNYKSFYEADGKFASTEIGRIAERGFVDLFDSWEAVVARWPNAKASKVALIVKEKPDGTHKTRLIIDLLRSGVNGDVVLPERVVLPRIADFVNGIVDLFEYDLGTPTSGESYYELCTVDFEDAFHTLPLKEQDRGVMAFQTLTGWAVFGVLCCGMAGAPLIWCRTSAVGCRLGQAIYQPHELRVQCFVDDPALGARGTPEQRRWYIGSLLLFWTVVGFRLNWRKGHRGQVVPWIGAQIAIERQPYGTQRGLFYGTRVTLAPGKFKELQDAVELIHGSRGLVPVKTIQRVAGQLSWASGMFTWIRGFNACLWAALTAHAAEQSKLATKWSLKKRPTQLFFVLRVQQAIAWIRKLLAGVVRDPSGSALVVQKWTSVCTRKAQMAWCVRTDASPFGMGAILFYHGAPKAWIAEEWAPEDYGLLQAQRGDPAWQAEWELLAVLIAVDAWLPHLHSQAMCLLQTDATAALHDAARMSGRTPAMNALAAELALRFESAQVHIMPEHLNGTLNFQCDALSRLAKGAAIPVVLMGIPRAVPKPRVPLYFWAWPRELLESRRSVQTSPAACGRGACGKMELHSRH